MSSSIKTSDIAFARLPGGRGDRSGPGSCVAGAHLALVGANPADAGARLVCGVVGPSTVAFPLVEKVQHGPGVLDSFSYVSMGSTVRRSVGNASILRYEPSQGNV